MNRRTSRAPVVAGALCVLAAACDDGAAPSAPDFISEDDVMEPDPSSVDGSEGGEGGGDEGGGPGGDSPAGGGPKPGASCNLDPGRVYLWFQAEPTVKGIEGSYYLADVEDPEWTACLIGATAIALGIDGEVIGYNDANRIAELKPNLPTTATRDLQKNDIGMLPSADCRAGDFAKNISAFPDRSGAVGLCLSAEKQLSYVDSDGEPFPKPARGEQFLFALGNEGLALWNDPAEPSEFILTRDGAEVATFTLPEKETIIAARAKDDGFMLATRSKKGRLYTISGTGQPKGKYVEYSGQLTGVAAMGPDGAVYIAMGDRVVRFDPGAAEAVNLLLTGDFVGPAAAGVKIVTPRRLLTGS